VQKGLTRGEWGSCPQGRPVKAQRKSEKIWEGKKPGLKKQGGSHAGEEEDFKEGGGWHVAKGNPAD